MVQSKQFQEWIKIEAARAMGQLSDINDRVGRELTRNVKVEVKDNGRWVEEK